MCKIKKLLLTVLLVNNLFLLGCPSLLKKTITSPPDGLITAQDRQFFISISDGTKPFVPWGFNYDRTVINGKDFLIAETLKIHPEKVSEDFAEMKKLNANTIRIFLSTAEFLNSPYQINPDAFERLNIIFAAARENNLKLILTGLANIDLQKIPEWLESADDNQIEQAEILFWKTIARHCRNESAVFAYDIQNEPVINWNDSNELTKGCFDMPSGTKYCYVHMHYRNISKLWTQYIHQKFVCESELKKHWADYPRENESWSSIAVSAFSAEDPRYKDYLEFHSIINNKWAKQLYDTIRTEDKHHLITIGALYPAVFADIVDFHCLHLYPGHVDKTQDYLKQYQKNWLKQMNVLTDNKPLLIEECFPLGLADGISFEKFLNEFITTTSTRATGWISFYWGNPQTLNFSSPTEQTIYSNWLDLWSNYKLKK